MSVENRIFWLFISILFAYAALTPQGRAILGRVMRAVLGVSPGNTPPPALGSPPPGSTPGPPLSGDPVGGSYA